MRAFDEPPQAGTQTDDPVNSFSVIDDAASIPGRFVIAFGWAPRLTADASTSAPTIKSLRLKATELRKSNVFLLFVDTADHDLPPWRFAIDNRINNIIGLLQRQPQLFEHALLAAQRDIEAVRSRKKQKRKYRNSLAFEFRISNQNCLCFVFRLRSAQQRRRRRYALAATAAACERNSFCISVYHLRVDY